MTPDSPVFTGETVNLTCVIESYSNWRYEWYKDRVMLQTSVNRDTLTIRGVNESDQGQYWCRGQRDERPKSSQDSNRINLSGNGEFNFPHELTESVFCSQFISGVVGWDSVHSLHTINYRHSEDCTVGNTGNNVELSL